MEEEMSIKALKYILNHYFLKLVLVFLFNLSIILAQCNITVKFRQTVFRLEIFLLLALYFFLIKNKPTKITKLC